MRDCREAIVEGGGESEWEQCVVNKGWIASGSVAEV